MAQSERGSSPPTSVDVARALPGVLAKVGGALLRSDLESELQALPLARGWDPTTERGQELRRETIDHGIAVGVAIGLIGRNGDALSLTDKGWETAGLSYLQAREPRRPAGLQVRKISAEEFGSGTIDLNEALAIVRYESHDGAIIFGNLRPDAQRFQGQPFVPPASALLDALYRAEIDGQLTERGFYSALRELGATGNATDLLESKCHVRLPGHVREERAARRDVVAIKHLGRGGRPARRPGMTWVRLVSEVLDELGGHADWQGLATALEKRPEVEQYQAWREETRQALRKHTSPNGRSLFEIVELGDRTAYTLTEQGRRLAARRAVDDRAPTLSRYLAKAVSAAGDASLTPHELYALFVLAVELGKPTEAQVLYNRLPENFPDEDRYYFAGSLLDRAEELRRSGG